MGQLQTRQPGSVKTLLHKVRLKCPFGHSQFGHSGIPSRNLANTIGSPGRDFAGTIRSPAIDFAGAIGSSGRDFAGTIGIPGRESVSRSSVSPGKDSRSPA